MNSEILWVSSEPTAIPSPYELENRDDDGNLQTLHALEDSIYTTEKSFKQAVQEYAADLLRLQASLRGGGGLVGAFADPLDLAAAGVLTPRPRERPGCGGPDVEPTASPTSPPPPRTAIAAAVADARGRAAFYRRQAALARVEYRLAGLWARFVEPWYRERVYAGFFLPTMRRLRGLSRRVERAHARLKGRYAPPGLLARGLSCGRPAEGSALSERDSQGGGEVGPRAARRPLADLLRLLLQVVPESAAALEADAARRDVLLFQLFLPAALEGEGGPSAAAVHSLLARPAPVDDNHDDSAPPLHALRRLLRRPAVHFDDPGAVDEGPRQLLALAFLAWEGSRGALASREASSSSSPDPLPYQRVLLALLRYLGGLHAHLQYCLGLISSSFPLARQGTGCSLLVESGGRVPKGGGGDCASNTNTWPQRAEGLLNAPSWRARWGATPGASGSIPPSWHDLLRNVKDMTATVTVAMPEKEDERREEEEMRELKEAFDVCCFAWMQMLQGASRAVGSDDDRKQRRLHDGEAGLNACDAEVNSMQMEIHMLYEWERAVQRNFQNTEMRWREETLQG